MRLASLSGVVTVAALVALAASGGGEERRIARADLPPAVEKALVEQSKGATIRGLSKELSGAKTVYEAELTVNGHARDIVIDESGRVVEVEEELALESLPPAVKAGLRKAAGAGDIVKVESLMKLGKLVAYEASVKTGSKHTEVKVGPDGKDLVR